MTDGLQIPIITLWNLLLVPLQGDISDRQAEQLTEAVLGRIARGSVRALIIDASGVWMMDSHLCNTLTRLSASAQLMGAPSIICGVSPEVVMTLQAMGVELSRMRTALTLEDALESFQIGPREATVDPGGLQLAAEMLRASERRR